MSFFDSIKKKLPTITGQQVELNICMMGPRAVGKTTILTSIFHDSDSKFSESSLYFRPTGSALEVINKGYQELCTIFSEYSGTENESPISGISATNKAVPFKFEFGLQGKDKTADVNVIDFPGEFTDENHPEHEKVVDYINKSQLIMVAIDTVHLMEENGRFNESRNRSKYLCKKILNLISKLPKNENKLILLVPLKCEKYFIEKKMSEVTNSTISAYKALIDGVLADYKERIGIAITPILTLGGVKFDKFARDENNQIIVDRVDNNNPQKALYKFHLSGQDIRPEYRPLFCVQPLYYLVSFTLNYYKKQKSVGSFAGIFKGLFTMFSSDSLFYDSCQKFVRYIKKEDHGYKVINNPNMF